MLKAELSHNKRRFPRAVTAVVFLLFFALFCFGAVMCAAEYRSAVQEHQTFQELASLLRADDGTFRSGQDQMPAEAASNNTSAGAGTHPAKTDPDPEQTGGSPEHEVLPRFASLHQKNPDFYGWISIAGTLIDYPVMFSPDRPEYYLHHAFDGAASNSGVPFLDSNCSEASKCFLIYGHHMRNQTMFGQLPLYAEQDFYREHPCICFDTLYEQRTYRIVAAFYSRVPGKDETDVFRYFDYTDLSDESTFNEFMQNVRHEALYDTEIQPEYGNTILILSTCSYHESNGRFVVVAAYSAG